MGQAKLRGSFEQRQAEGIAKRHAEEVKRTERFRRERAERAEREANMTPEQKARATKVRGVFAALTAMVAASEAQNADFANAMRNFNAG